MKSLVWLSNLTILFFFVLAYSSYQVSAAECRPDTSVRIAGFDYDSGAFGAALVSEMITRGYGCETKVQEGGTLDLVNSLISGDLDVTTELWEANAPAGWADAEAAGKVVKLGRGYAPTQEGWFVPSYMVEGPSAPAPTLRSVFDLPALKQLFSVPGEMGLGRFYNCPLGTQCQILNSKKLSAYGLAPHFMNYIPSSEASLEDAIEFAMRRREPILFYHWQPSALLAAGRFIQLKEPTYDPTTWHSLLGGTNPKRGCSSPLTSIAIAANASFVSGFPGIGEMLRRMDLSRDEVIDAQIRIRKDNLSPKAAVLRFLHEHKEVWARWVSPTAADNISESLKKNLE